MLIDRFLPRYDVTMVCETSIAASPDDAYAAMRETNLLDPIVKALFTLRDLPLRIVRRLRKEPPPPPAPSRVTFGDVLQGPMWIPLIEELGPEGDGRGIQSCGMKPARRRPMTSRGRNSVGIGG